jgi:endonuclease G
MRTFRRRLALALSPTLLALLAYTAPPSPHTRAQTFDETFESGTKTAYAAADVQLATGFWNFNDALIGNLSTDHKTGTAAARIRDVGIVQMDFDVASAGTVTVQLAVFGADGASSKLKPSEMSQS